MAGSIDKRFSVRKALGLEQLTLLDFDANNALIARSQQEIGDRATVSTGCG